MSKHPEWKSAFKRAVEIAGGQTHLAAKIGTSQPYVWFLIHKAKKFPPELASKIEDVTGGQVTRAMLRPDIFHEAA